MVIKHKIFDRKYYENYIVFGILGQPIYIANIRVEQYQSYVNVLKSDDGYYVNVLKSDDGNVPRIAAQWTAASPSSSCELTGIR